MTRVALVEGIRTPFAKAGSALASIPAQELGRIAVRELIERTGVEPKSVDEVIIGNISGPVEATNIGRVIALMAGHPLSGSAHTVARNCASGMQSITEGFELIRGGQAHAVIAGGTESMSNMPLLFPKEMSLFMGELAKARSLPQKLKVMLGFRLKFLKPIISIIEGLKDPFSGLNMGQTAELLAKEFNVTREEQDQFALDSHMKAVAATESGRLPSECVPVYVKEIRKAVEQDIGPRAEQTMEALAKLKPYFDRKHGTVTVGNACPVTDGAAAVLLMSEERAKQEGREPIAYIKSYGYAGIDPSRMGLGPTVSTPVALRKAGLTMKDIGLVEINEAFAAQVISCLRIFENPKLGEPYGANAAEVSAVDPEILNVNGGAIALGHPVGTTGTRITMTLAKEMKNRNVPLGLATLCVGGGQGGAIILEQN